MKILIAPQALKGSLDAVEVAEAIARGVEAVWPEAALALAPVADGGEGTVRALVAATGGEYRSVRVTGPLGELVVAQYGVLGERGARAGDAPTTEPATGRRTAVIEMASTAGLPLLPLERRDARITTTFGVGELIRAALEDGCRDILLGLGGSATNDGGAGMAQALGARLLDADGADLPPGGAALARLARVDVSALDPRLAEATLLVACDVTNPLTGPEGASAVYGPQKGATPDAVRELDAALAHYANVLWRDLGVAVAEAPGAGAAGGLGAGLLAFTGARLVPGAQLVLDALDLAGQAAGAALVVTAEGRLDAQTAYGKSVWAVAQVARQAGARVIALAGSLAADDATLDALGIDVALPLADGPLSLDASMARAAELVTNATRRALRLIALGATLQRS